MKITPVSHIRRAIGDRIYYLVQGKTPKLVQVNADADAILSIITKEMRVDELHKLINPEGLTVDELKDFIVACEKEGLLASRSTRSMGGSAADQEKEKAFDELGAYAVKERIPIAGTMELTTRCNLRCVHCYLGKPNNPARKLLGLTEWLDILDQVVEAGCLWMSITGGEAILNPHFEDIYRFLYNHGVMVTVLSNGTNINERISRLFEEMPPDKVEVSIYGASRSVYECVTQVPGSFDRFMSGINTLSKLDMPLDLKAILLTPNASEFTAMRNIAEKIGAHFRYSGEIHEELVGGKMPTKYRLDARQVASLELNDPERSGYFSDNLKCGRTVNKKLYRCLAGTNGFHLGEEGTVHPCIIDRAVSFPLSIYSLEEIWGNQMPQAISRCYAGDETCFVCGYRDACKVCPPKSRMAGGDGISPVKFLCELAKERTRLMQIREEVI